MSKPQHRSRKQDRGAALRSCLLVACAVLLGVLLAVTTIQPVQAQSSLTPDVSEALGRLSAGSASETARALLFANNDAVNAARLNNEIPDAAYQAAQGDFDRLNQGFAKDAANAAGAEFTVQQRSSQTFSPGTDSDYITEVKNKGQIADMQDGYNQRVNEYLRDNGVPAQRDNWHNKLDTDFMADPRHITDPEEFRDIARLNNDAYKNRFAAEYERLSRAKDGSRIGPQHVNGYMDEMNAFARKKGNKIEDMLSKGPSHFNDPRKRAELFQAMAQEQKYTSRLESLDDFLRAQEGLPPRNRGLTISKAGSNRSPHNAGTIRRARSVADASRFSALEDLAETMGQVATRNPAFNANAADDIARIVEGLPQSRRAGILSRIRANGGAGLVEDIVAASARAGRLPPGSASLADDLARAGADDLARATGNLDDLARAGKGRRALRAAGRAMETIGKVAATAEVAMAAGQLNDYFDLMERATDPDVSDEEANALFERAQLIAETLRDSAALTAIMERYPAVAAIYGAWAIGCAAGEWVSPSKKPMRPGGGGTCLDRHMTAWDRAVDWWTGKDKEREANWRSLCGKFLAALREKRVALRGSFRTTDVCNAIRRGDPISDMLVTAAVSPEEIEEADPPPELVSLVPPTCDASGNQAIVAGLREAAAAGSPDALAHIGHVEAVNRRIARVEAALDAARQSYAAGDMDAVRASLSDAQSVLGGDEPGCPDLSERIANGMDKAERLDRVLSAARDSVDSCSPDAVAGARASFGQVEHPALQAILAEGDAVISASARYQDAKAEFAAGRLAAAQTALDRAKRDLDGAASDGCSALREDIARGQGRIDKLRDAIRSAEQAVVACDEADMQRWRTALRRVVNPAAAAIKGQLERGEKACRERQRDERIAASNARCRDSFGEHSFASSKTAATDNPQCGCKKGYQWNKGRTTCVRAPTEQELAQDRKRNCRAQFGKGYYPGPVNSKGVYYCLPTQVVANAECRKLNGKGVVASKVKRDGTYTCRRTRASQRQIALNECRKKYGRAFIRLVRRNGQYFCEHATRRTAQPSHSSRNSAAVVGAIGGIIDAIGNQGSGAAARPQQRAPSRSSRAPTTRRQGPVCKTHDSSTSKYFLNQTDPRCF